jgi:hypothetical protein
MKERVPEQRRGVQDQRAERGERERLMRPNRPLIARPAATEALASTSATMPAARLVIQKKCVPMLAASIAIQDCLVVSAVGVLAGELVVLLALPEDTEPLLAPVVAVAMCA